MKNLEQIVLGVVEYRWKLVWCERLDSAGENGGQKAEENNTEEKK